ncbi:MAG: hypothetical protein ACMXYB_02805 [Candidatus Woesearchaeota archaeon]
MKITINDTLQKKGNEQVNKHSIEHEMFRRIIEEKNNIITSKMNIKEVDEIELILVNSKSKISTFLITQETQFPIAYKEGTNQIMTLHPKMTGQLFQNHEEEYSKLLEYALLKMYIHNTYSTKSTNQMGFFYKYCSETAAQILSGKYLDKISEFEIKMYSPGKKITKKDVEIGLFFYLLKELSGIDFIYQHLDTIFKEQNVKTSLHTIYKKNFDDLILPLKEKLLEEQRKTLELQKRARQDQRRPMHKINQREDSNPSSANFSNNRNHIHKKFDTKEKKEAPLVNIDKL